MPLITNIESIRGAIRRLAWEANMGNVNRQVAPPLAAAAYFTPRPKDAADVHEELHDVIEQASDDYEEATDAGQSTDYSSPAVGALCDMGMLIGLEPTNYCLELNTLWNGCVDTPPDEWFDIIERTGLLHPKKAAQYAAQVGIAEFLYYLARYAAGSGTAKATPKLLELALACCGSARNIAHWCGLVMKMESGYNPAALNKTSDAQGWFQILPIARRSSYARRQGTANPLPPWPAAQASGTTATPCTQARYGASIASVWLNVLMQRMYPLLDDPNTILWRPKQSKEEPKFTANARTIAEAVNRSERPSRELFTLTMLRTMWWLGPYGDPDAIQDWSVGRGQDFINTLASFGLDTRGTGPLKFATSTYNSGGNSQAPAVDPISLPDDEGPVSSDDEYDQDPTEYDDPAPNDDESSYDDQLPTPQDPGSNDYQQSAQPLSYPPFDTAYLSHEGELVQAIAQNEPDLGPNGWALAAYDALYGDAAPRPINQAYMRAALYQDALIRLQTYAASIVSGLNPEPVDVDEDEIAEANKPPSAPPINGPQQAITPPGAGTPIRQIGGEIMGRSPWYNESQFAAAVIPLAAPQAADTIFNLDEPNGVVTLKTTDAYRPAGDWDGWLDKIRQAYTDITLNTEALNPAPSITNDAILEDLTDLYDKYGEQTQIYLDLDVKDERYQLADFIYHRYAARSGGPWVIDPNQSSHDSWRKLWLKIEKALR